jgi:hypothetical protein
MRFIMKSTQTGKWVTGFVLAVLLVAPAVAAEIYKWVDENGVTHFSQMPPDLSVTGVSQQVLRDTRPSDYDPEQDIYGVEAQAKRMQQLRDEKKERYQARLEREREARKQQVIQHRSQEYYGYPLYRPGWGNPRPPLLPTPPVARPPGGLLPTPPVARQPSLPDG